ncbi:MAG: IPExxxVDY family protein [Flavobacteriales bacterium]
MAKFVLDNDFDYELLLIGISSHARDYRVCWSLNSTMRLNLSRIDKGLKMPASKNADPNEFTLFEYEDEETRIFYSLIANKNKNAYLIPELKHADYLLMLRNNITIDIPNLLERVRSCDQVLTAFEIQTEELKSRDNLIYF